MYKMCENSKERVVKRAFRSFSSATRLGRGLFTGDPLGFRLGQARGVGFFNLDRER